MRRSIIAFVLVLSGLFASTAFGQHFRFDVNQGNHSIIVEESRINGEFTEAGDEVAVFTPGGVCSGATVFEERGNVSVGIAAWGDDQDQAGVNGFRNGERIFYRFWDRGTNHEVDAEPTYAMGSETYERDAFSILSLSGNLEGPGIVAIRQGENALGEGGGDQISFDFGNVMVNESEMQTFTLGNAGINQLVISDLVASSNVFSTNFPEEGFTLNTGESADVEVTFTPAEETNYDETLTIVSDADHGDVVMQLIGNGTVEHIANIVIDPVQFGFGDVEIGHPATTDLTISNSGNSELTILEMNVNGNAYSVNFDGEVVIAEGGNLVYQITFAPPEAGAFDGVITIVSDDPDENSVDVTLTGTGFVVPVPDIAVDHDNIDFGDVVVGESVNTTLVISNVGDEPLNITGISSDNEVFITDFEAGEQNGPHFQFLQTDGNQSVLVLEALLNGEPLEVDDEIGAFTPNQLCVGAAVITEVGAAVGLAAFGDDRDEAGVQGLMAGEAISLKFWDRSARRVIAAEVEIISGSLNYERDALAIVSLSAGNQQQPAEDFETAIDPGGSLEVNITFSPTDFVDYNGVLTISSNDPESPELEVPMTGSGADEPPQIELSDNAIAFSELVLNETEENVLTVRNLGSQQLTGSFEIAGDGAEFFTVDPMEFAIDGGADQDMIIAFTPTEAGEWNAILTVFSNDPAAGQMDVALSGAGREPAPNIYVGDAGGFMFDIGIVAIDFGQVFLGDSESNDLTLSNFGEVALTIDQITSDNGAFVADLPEAVRVEPDRSVVIAIGFAPDEEVNYDAILTIHSNDPDLPEYQVRVVGQGVLERLPDIMLDADMLDFQALIPGEQRTMAIIGSNVGLANLTITSVNVAGAGFQANFAEPIVVSPNEAFSIDVVFAPEEIGEFNGTATIVSDDPDEDRVVVALSGRAIGEGEHFQFTITADNMSVIVEDAMIDGDRLLEGDEVAVFTPGGFCAGATLIEGEWPIGVAIWGEDNNLPGPEGFREGEEIAWKIWDRSSGREIDATADYSDGNGIFTTNGFSVATLDARNEAVALIVTDPGMVDFGLVLRDDSRSVMVTIFNLGNGQLDVEDVTTNGAPFTVAFDGPFSVAPDGSAEVEVTFSPEETAEFHGTLTIFSNAINGNEFTIDLFGVAIDPSPAQILISSDRHQFNELGVGEMEAWALEVTNVGGEVLVVDAPVLDGEGFMVHPQEGFELGVGATAMLHVTFAPEAVGDFNGTLTLNSNDPNNGSVVIELVGSAVASPLHWRFQQTDSNMSLLIENATLDGEQIPAGSEIGVFTPDGIPAGSMRVEEFSLGMAAWGDDVNTENIVEGFTEGDALSFRIWLPDLGAEFDAAAEYAEGEGIYSRDAFAVLSLASTTPEGQGHFFYSVTNSNHSILVLSAMLNDEALQVGDEVAVFTEHGLCGGVVILEEAGDQAFGLAAWGDDIDTQPVEGFTNGEDFAFRFWDASAGREYANVEAIVEEGPTQFTANAFTVLSLDLYLLPQPEISLELAHNFGVISTEESASWDLVIANTGNADLLLSSVGDLGEPFSVNFEGEVTVPAGESVAYSVVFAPTERGDYQDDLLVFSNDRNEAMVAVTLTGSAFDPNHAPVWVDAPEMVQGAENELLEIFLTATDPDGNDLALSMVHGELENQVTFVDNGDGTGSFSWTPGYLDAGEYRPLFIASDGDLQAEVEILIVISDVNAPPEFVDYPREFVVEEGTRIAFQIIAQDVDGEEFNITYEFIAGQIQGEPDFEDHRDGTADFSWSPTFEDAGDYIIRLTLLGAHDEMVTADIAATVIDVNRAPEVVNPIADVESMEDVVAQIADLNHVFADPDGDGLSFSVDGPEEFGLTIDENGILWLMPEENFFGEGDATVSADDGRNLALIPVHVINNLNAPSAARVNPGRQLRSVSLAGSPDEAISRDEHADDTFMITILPENDQPVWLEVPRDAIHVDEGGSVAFDVLASDIDSQNLTLTFERGNFPDGAVLNDQGGGQGSFIWEPDFFSAGNYRGELVVTDGDQSDRVELFVTVHNSNRPPVWDDVPEHVNGREGVRLGFDISGSDADNDNLTISIIDGNLPEEVELTDNHNGTATFVWTPGFDQAGDYSATFRIADNEESVDAEVMFHIAHVNRPPTIREFENAELAEDADRTDLYALADFFSDPDGDDLQFTLDADELLNGRIENGILSVDPDDNMSGEFPINVSARDDEFAVENEFVLTVIPSNDEPFWVDPIQEVEVNEGQRIEFVMLGNDIDLEWEGDALEVFLRDDDGVIEGGASFDHEGPRGVFTWVTDFEDAGVYNPVFRVEDGAGTSADVTVEIRVVAVNRAPEIVAPTDEDDFDVEVDEMAELRVDFEAEDEDGDNIEWSMTDVGGLPNGFQFTDHGDGTATLLWTPGFDARRQPYTPVFAASDGQGGTDQIQVTITVNNVNRNPIITAPANADLHRVAIEEGQRLVIDFGANDPDGGDLEWEVPDDGGLPNGWQFVDNQDGTAEFVWDVPFNAAGQYRPVFRTADEDEGIDEITVEITVQNTNRAPEISQPSDQEVIQTQIAENEELAIGFLAADPDNEAVAWRLLDDGGIPGEFEFVDNGQGRAAFTWTPTFDDARDEPYVPVFEAVDPNGLPDRITIEITVTNVNRAPETVGQMQNVVVNEDEGRFDIANDLNQFFRDLDGDALQFAFAGAPAELGMGIENARLLFINPAANYNLAGGVLITITATDGAEQASQQFRVTVTPLNDAPGAFALLTPVDSDTLEDYRGVFSWRSAPDIDRDVVRYSVVFTLIDAPIDSTFRSPLIQDTMFALTGLDTLVAIVGLEEYLGVRWWVEATDGQAVVESQTRRTVVIPPLSAPGEEDILPTEISLSQNYPNPFNPETKISFALPQASDVTLSIYDMHARTVATIAQGRYDAGIHEVTWNAVSNPAGIYLFVLQTNGERRIVKGAMLK